MLELVPSGTLRDAIESFGAFEFAAASFFFCNIIAGLAFLETHDILHRDLKPENILLGGDGYLVLCDFGSSVKLSDPDASRTLVGTPAYMAPELLSPHNPPGKIHEVVDWWSSGCILFEMVSGRRVCIFVRSQGARY